MTGQPIGDLPPVGAPERPLPPIAEMAVATMILVVLAGISITAYVPRPVPLGPPVGLLAAAVGLLIANLVALGRLREFAWDTFFLVGRWALLAYVVIAGMLEYVFILDQTPGDILVLLTVALGVFAVDIPMLFAFSVARYQPARDSSPR